MRNPEFRYLPSLRGDSPDQVPFLAGAGALTIGSNRFTETTKRFPYGLPLNNLGRILLGAAVAVFPTIGVAVANEGVLPKLPAISLKAPRLSWLTTPRPKPVDLQTPLEQSTSVTTQPAESVASPAVEPINATETVESTPLDPTDPALLKEQIWQESLDNGVNPAIVLALIDSQRDSKARHGLTVGKSKANRKGFGLLTYQEWAQGIRLKIQDDKAKGIETDFSWYVWGDPNVDPQGRIGADDITAAVTLIKHGIVFTSLRESALIIDRILKSGDTATINLGNGLSLDYFLQNNGIGAELIKRIIEEQQRASLVSRKTVNAVTSAGASPAIMGIPLEELIAKHLGSRGNINWWVNRISIESEFKPDAEDGSYVGLLQIDVNVHKALIIRTLGIDTSKYEEKEITPLLRNLLKNPDNNLRVAAAVYDEAAVIFKNGLHPWGVGGLIALSRPKTERRRPFRKAVLSSLDLDRLVRNDQGEWEVRVRPPTKAEEEQFIDRWQEMIRYVHSLRTRSIRVAAYVRRKQAREAGLQVELHSIDGGKEAIQTESYQTLHQMITEVNSRFEKVIDPEVMRGYINRATQSVKPGDRGILRRFYRGFQPDQAEMENIERIINAQPSPEVKRIVLENDKARATTRARQDLQKAFKTLAGTRMGSTKKPELYQVKRDEAFVIISELDSQVIANISEHITAQSLLTNTLGNRRLRKALNITREQILNSGEDQLNRIKAYKVISESINRSEAVHEARERKRKQRDYLA